MYRFTGFSSSHIRKRGLLESRADQLVLIHFAKNYSSIVSVIFAFGWRESNVGTDAISGRVALAAA